jgi:Cu2+-containing amine oxidase
MLVNHPKTVHPLLTLQPQEVTATSNIIRQANPGRDVVFRIIAIKEPRRSLVVVFLEAERSSAPLPHVPRCTYVSYQFKGQPEAFEDIVDLGAGKVIFHKELPEGVHPPAGTDDMLAVQQLVLEDDLVKAEIARLKIPEGVQVVPEAWPYGKDTNEADPKQYQVWFFLGSLDPKNHAHPSSNHFAHPLDFSAIVDDVTKKVVMIDRLPMGDGLYSLSGDDDVYQPQPDAEYASELQPSLRQDVKPIIISQPEGVSFTVEDDQII